MDGTHPWQLSPRGASSYVLCLRWFCGAHSPWGRLGWSSYVGLYAPLTTPAALLHLIIYRPFIKRVGWVVHCSLHGVIIGLESDTKSFVPFQGFALLRLRVVADIPESGLSDIRHHPPPLLPSGRLKRSKIKKPPLAVKKARLAPVQKVISLFSYRQVSIRWNNTSNCFFTANGGFFERPTAAFFTVAAVVAMQRMALGMVVMTRRKTRFPTGVATVTKKAKPTTAVMAFCVYIILYYVLLWVTPTAKRNTYSVAIIVGYILPRVACFHPQPWAVESQLRQSCRCRWVAPPRPSPRGGSPYLLCLRMFGGAPSPWRRLGWGFYVGRRKPLPSFPFWGKPERGLSLHSLPLGRVGEGLLGEGLLGLLLSLHLCHHLHL